MAATKTQLPQAVPMAKQTFHAAWAAKAIQKNLGSIEQAAFDVRAKDKTRLIPAKDSKFSPAAAAAKVSKVSAEGLDGVKDEPLRVGIVGAGAAGLFTAMIFDHLEDKYGLKVEYEILESNDHVGGRLFSYYFEDTDPDYPLGPHDYYDVGAMRFPLIPAMTRTFQLFETLGMATFTKENRPKEVPKGSVVPYYWASVGEPWHFNGIQVLTRVIGQKITARSFNITTLPEDIVDVDVRDLVNLTIQPFKDKYANEGPAAFWKMLMDEAEGYSVRQWMSLKANYTHDTIEWLEATNYGNRWYDQGLTQMIIENMDYDAKADWFCVEGGVQEIAKRMHKQLKRPDAVEFGKDVRAISYVEEDVDDDTQMLRERVQVSVRGEAKPREYDAVFNSATLAAMQHMQLDGLKLNWGTKQAIRSLGYSAASKVAIRFKRLWWIEKGIRKGGQGRSDLPLGTCVYPSYNVNDPVDKPGVLLVSYTWSQAAARLGALISRDSPNREAKLKELMIHDLALMHARCDDDGSDFRRMRTLISDNYISHHAWAWYDNPRTAGAFAYFGPGQYLNMYPWITRTDGKHIIIGEAASAHHTWVVGALESAVRGVYQFLHRHSETNEAAAAAAQAYEMDDASPIEGPFGPLPAEFSWTDDIELADAAAQLAPADLPSANGGLARLQVMFETIRLSQKEPEDQIYPSIITHDAVKDKLVMKDAAQEETLPIRDAAPDGKRAKRDSVQE